MKQKFYYRHLKDLKREWPFARWVYCGRCKKFRVPMIAFYCHCTSPSERKLAERRSVQHE